MTSVLYMISHIWISAIAIKYDIRYNIKYDIRYNIKYDIRYNIRYDMIIR